MTRYLLRRVLQSIVLLVVVSIIGFGVLNLAPGGPLAAYALNPGMTQADRDRLAHQLGLDQPLPVQYGRWVSGLLVRVDDDLPVLGQPGLAAIRRHHDRGRRLLPGPGPPPDRAHARAGAGDAGDLEPLHALGDAGRGPPGLHAYGPRQ